MMNHKIIFLPATSLFFLSLLFTPFGFAAPPNDDLTNAIHINALPYSNQQDTQEATEESAEAIPSCTDSSGASVWYQYTPLSDQTVLFDTIGSEHDYDTVLSVWYGETHPLNLLDCNDDDGTGEKQSQLSVPLEKNTTYYIQISGYEGNSGTVQFNAKSVNPLVNDDLTDAIEITGNFVDSQAQITEGATNQDNETTASCASNEASVWYQLTASTDQAVVFDTFGSNYNTVLSVWTGEQHPLTEIACNDDEGIRDTQQSQISMALSEGTTYYLRITGGTDSEAGLLVLNTTFFSSNDDVAHAIPIESLPYSYSQNTTHTTLEFEELISKCGLRDSTSVWYQYTPSTDQQVSFSTEGSDYDTILSLWTGEAHPLTELDCNDDAITGEEGEQTSQISLPLTAENTYFIKVSSSAEKTGNLVLQVESTINDISILEQPVEQTIVSGEKATLTIKASGTKPLSYQWYEGKSGDVSIPRINAKTFTTPPLTETVHYWVRVTNPTGTIDSQTATITVGEKITNGIGIDTEGHEISSQTNFVGNVTTSADEKESIKIVSQTDEISVTFKITVDANHVGQSADIIMVGIYTIDVSYFYMRQGGSVWNLWDGDFANLEVAETKKLTESVDVTVYESNFNGLPGLFTVYVGYRLDNGSIFYTSEPITFTVE